MKFPGPLWSIVSAIALLGGFCSAQNLPGTISFTVAGSFSSGTAESGSSLLISDNNLANGYKEGFDLHDAPSSLSSTGPSGSTAFQWGKPSTGSAYPHASALWYAPTTVTGVSAEQTFKVGDLFYRNGTIISGTGASSVDLNLAFTINGTLVQTDYTMDLINTTNTSDPVASADIVSLGNHSSQLEFTDAQGNHYYLDLTFRPDQQTLAGTLSTENEFHVTEGSQAKAELWGRFTVIPLDSTHAVPEPSAALLGALSTLLLFRRKR